MSPQVHSLEIRFGAEELFVENQMTHEEISQHLSVGLSTVKGWSSAGKWKQLREERIQAKYELRQNLFKLRDSMMREAANSKDPQKVFAVIRLEKMAQDTESKRQDITVDIDHPKVFLENMEFVAEVLKEVDPEGLKALGRNFDEIIRRFKEKHAQAA